MAPSALLSFFGFGMIPSRKRDKGGTKSHPSSHSTALTPSKRLPKPPGPSAPAPAPRAVPPASPPQPQWQPQYDGANYQFRPAGYLPAPNGWMPPSAAAYPYEGQAAPPIIMHQHYYISPAAQPPMPLPKGPINCGGGGGGSSGGGPSLADSMGNTANDVLPPSLQVAPPPRYDECLPAWHDYGTQILNQSAAICDRLQSRLNDVLTSIDLERYNGNERELFTLLPVQSPAIGPLAPGQPVGLLPAASASAPPSPKPSSALTRSSSKRSTKKSHHRKDHSKCHSTALTANTAATDYFAKVDLYANSKLPMNLAPLKLYIPTWPILCLAAQYSERVYENPRGAERDTHVDSDWRTGAKAMTIKSVPMDHMNTIVFAIRGTATFMDWTVNLNTAPASPKGFLDDPGNFCHAGFLSVARSMVAPVAARLRRLLEEDPGRRSYSLLLTGHSAGGAVAALLYSHMMGSGRNGSSSELSQLAGCFRRVHCVTFGAPPVSLLPLTAPEPAADDGGSSSTATTGGGNGRKSLFLSFVNEGDPVARADKAYVKSLLELFAAPAPPSSSSMSREGGGSSSSGSSSSGSSSSSGTRSHHRPGKKSSSSSVSGSSSTHSKKSSSSSGGSGSGSSSRSSRSSGPVWPVPQSTLSNAGRVVVLRSGDPKSRLKGRKTVEERLNEGVVAQITSDDQLRNVIWGDPVAHLMRLYAGRIEVLAVGAVTAKGY